MKTPSQLIAEELGEPVPQKTKSREGILWSVILAVGFCFRFCSYGIYNLQGMCMTIGFRVRHQT